jgi:hypothetical protein
MKLEYDNDVEVWNGIASAVLPEKCSACTLHIFFNDLHPVSTDFTVYDVK